MSICKARLRKNP